MSDVGVRRAHPSDADPVTEVQVRAWRTWDFLPEAALNEMIGAQPLWRDRWLEAIERPPGPGHRVLVAVSSGEVAGFAAHAPGDEPDIPGAAELLTLLVDPDQARLGHGSRLLNATMDHLREDGIETAATWVFAANEPFLSLLAGAGWGPDGAERIIDMDSPVRMIRLTTDISG